MAKSRIVTYNKSSCSVLDHFNLIDVTFSAWIHAELAYSNLERTRVVYALDFTSLLQSHRTLLNRPSVPLALLQI